MALLDVCLKYLREQHNVNVVSTNVMYDGGMELIVEGDEDIPKGRVPFALVIEEIVPKVLKISIWP